MRLLKYTILGSLAGLLVMGVFGFSVIDFLSWGKANDNIGFVFFWFRLSFVAGAVFGALCYLSQGEE